MIRKNWFFIGIVLVVCTAFAFPGLRSVIQKYQITTIGLFLAFFLTGLLMETNTIIGQLKEGKALFTALLSSLIFFPVAAYYLGTLFLGGQADFLIGLLIIGVAPVTVVSGTVMTATAMGNIPLSLFICVFGNLCSIATIPLVLNFMLQLNGASIQLPVALMLKGLALKVLLPTLLGQILRSWLRHRVAAWKPAISVFNQCVVLLIILNAVLSSAGGILEMKSRLLLIVLFMIGFHIFILLFNGFLAKALGLDQASTAAFVIHTSQKTLTVSYLVWASFFAGKYPLALIPGIAYHLIQMVMDTFVAQWFRYRGQLPAT